MDGILKKNNDREIWMEYALAKRESSSEMVIVNDNIRITQLGSSL